jgi:hypothetical protein
VVDVVVGGDVVEAALGGGVVVLPAGFEELDGLALLSPLRSDVPASVPGGGAEQAATARAAAETRASVESRTSAMRSVLSSMTPHSPVECSAVAIPGRLSA